MISLVPDKMGDREPNSNRLRQEPREKDTLFSYTLSNKIEVRKQLAVKKAVGLPGERREIKA